MSADHEKESEKATEAASRSSSEVVTAKNEADNATNDAEAAAEYPKGAAFIMIVVALLLNVFMIALDQTIVATAIPKITDQFKGLEKVGWYASAYFMTFGGFQMTFGKVFKYFSLKTSFLLSMLIFEVGSLMCGVAKNSNTLIAGRAIAGLGGAGVATGAFVIVAFAIEPKMRATYQGLMAATYGVSAIAGPLLGGAFADKVTWRWCFYINLPIGGLTGAIMFFFFHTPASAKPQQATWKEKLIQLDPVGTVLMMGAIISFILAMERGGQTESWGSSTVIGLLVGFVVILIAFAALQAYLGERGMMPWRILRMRSVWTGAVFQACFGGGYFIVLYYLPIYFQSVKGASPINSGVRNLPMIIPVVIASIVGGVFTTVTGRASVVAVFGSVLAVICSALLYTFDIGTPAGKWIGYQVIGGFGWGIAWMVSLVITQAYAKPEDMSTATAIVLFTQQLGGALGVAAAQSAFVNKLIHRLAITAPDVNGLLVVGTGATQIRSTFPPTQVPAIVDAYMLGVKTAFILTIAYSSLAVLVSFCMDFRALPAHREAQESKKEIAKEEIAAAAASETPV